MSANKAYLGSKIAALGTAIEAMRKERSELRAHLPFIMVQMSTNDEYEFQFLEGTITALELVNAQKQDESVSEPRALVSSVDY